jgi:hypothetical protein
MDEDLLRRWKDYGQTAAKSEPQHLFWESLCRNFVRDGCVNVPSSLSWDDLLAYANLSPCRIPKDGSCWSHVVTAWTSMLKVGDLREKQNPSPSTAVQECDHITRRLLHDSGFTFTGPNKEKDSVMISSKWLNVKKGSPVLQRVGSYGGQSGEYATWRAITVCSHAQRWYFVCVPAPPDKDKADLKRWRDPTFTGVYVYSANKDGEEELSSPTAKDFLLELLQYHERRLKPVVVFPYVPKGSDSHFECYIPARCVQLPLTSQCIPPSLLLRVTGPVHGTVRHGPVRHGPVRHGPVRHGPVRHGPDEPVLLRSRLRSHLPVCIRLTST